MTRDERSTVAWAVVATVVFMTVIMVVAEESAATIALVDSVTATGLIALLLLLYAVVLVAAVAWHRRPVQSLRPRPLPRRPAPSTRARHGGPERRPLVAVDEAARKRPEPAQSPADALPRTPPARPAADEPAPLAKTRADLGELPGWDALFDGWTSRHAVSGEQVSS